MSISLAIAPVVTAVLTAVMFRPTAVDEASTPSRIRPKRG